MRTSAPLVCLLGIALLALPAAGALYVYTPLQLHTENHEVDVGDKVDFRVQPDPENETARTTWAGKSVKVVYSWDPNEGNRAPEDETPRSRAVAVESLALGPDAKATFTWTVPEEVRDRNVDVTVESMEGEMLAVIPMVVGNAEPLMRVASGPAGGGQPQPVETPMEQGNPDSGAPPTQESGGADDTRNVPGAAPVLFALAVGAAALLVARRRG